MIDPLEIIKIIKDICLKNGNEISLQEDSPILNGDISIDSMVLMELCMELEDKSEEFGFNFNWTSDQDIATNNIFKNPKSISDEFNRQLSNKKNK